MNKIKSFYSDYRDYILVSFSFVIFILVSAFLFYYFSNSINGLKNSIKDRPVVEVRKDTKDSEKYAVNIKGEVKKPGVYYLDKDKRVIDVVNKAGGFTKNADSFVNNLSMKITDEMVIIIYSKSEIENYEATKTKENIKLEKCKEDIIVNNSCIEEDKNSKEKSKSSNTSSIKENDNSKSTESNNSDNNSSIDKKVSINTASKEELMTLSGIGESKAVAIIEYRKTKQFETIEEVKEVPGIGDALFEKIKDFITT